ncbi:hypothetical protein [Methylocystis sp.]|uniref:hypothetical protein n=1 Tax=Methylocystis sp. TaxID=1911079 RepID=UPI0025CBB41E|nr:hypothetical protein [Methylocystis sp.]
MPRKTIDMTGQTFGALTIVGPAHKVRTHQHWRCRCDCGNERIARRDALVTGQVQGCVICDPPSIRRGLRSKRDTCEVAAP